MIGHDAPRDLDPHGVTRGDRTGAWHQVAWEAGLVAMVVASGILVTYQAAFRREVNVGGSLIVYLIDLVFLADIVRNFRLPYRERGIRVTDSRRIARHYARGTFVVDLVGTLPIDLLFLGWSTFAPGGVSIVLLLRLLRLVRIVRLFTVFRRWEEQSWSNVGYLRIGELVAVIVLLLHTVACAWFLVPAWEGFPPDSWMVREGVVTADAATQYIRALYWVIVTTTTVGFGDITPHRNVEYVFSMGVILLGASMYAFVIGSIASLVSRIDGGKAAFWDRVENVSAYLRARRVPPEINAHVRSYYEYVWATYRGTDHQSLLRDLPPPMRLDVLLHLTKDLLVHVPMFRHCTPALRDVLLLALRPAIYAPGDAIVREGESADGVYFISRGTVEVLSQQGTQRHGTLESGDHFGDLSLLLAEQRTGTARAVTFCDVFVLPKREFERIKQEHDEFRDVLKRVAAERSEKLQELVLEGVVL